MKLTFIGLNISGRLFLANSLHLPKKVIHSNYPLDLSAVHVAFQAIGSDEHRLDITFIRYDMEDGTANAILAAAVNRERYFQPGILPMRYSPEASCDLSS